MRHTEWPEISKCKDEIDWKDQSGGCKDWPELKDIETI